MSAAEAITDEEIKKSSVRECLAAREKIQAEYRRAMELDMALIQQKLKKINERLVEIHYYTDTLEHYSEG